MEKIYGYKQDDVELLAEYLKNRRGGSLSKAFSEYGALHNKAKGTVRNLYYALAKKSVEDEQFCNKYFDGVPIKVSKIVEFDLDEESRLIKQILMGRANGNSVRSVIMQIADGDAKKALRYQNKYRNALKNKPQLIEKIYNQLKEDGVDLSLIEPNKTKESAVISDEQINQIKKGIDALVGKISIKIKKENLRLLKIIYGYSKDVLTSPYILDDKNGNIIS